MPAQQIYNEEVRDLLANSGEKKEKLELKEDPNKGVYIKVFSGTGGKHYGAIQRWDIH